MGSVRSGRRGASASRWPRRSGRCPPAGRLTAKWILSATRGDTQFEFPACHSIWACDSMTACHSMTKRSYRSLA